MSRTVSKRRVEPEKRSTFQFTLDILKFILASTLLGIAGYFAMYASIIVVFILALVIWGMF